MNDRATHSPREPLLRRLAETTGRAPVAFVLDGEPASALDGDTVLTAVLTQHARLRRNEFSGQPRAGFCLMGACQDCWIATGEGARLRACTTFIARGMVLLTGGDAA
jgi:predicted molibdopterin-dependent oxidoreductase YjgC